MSKPLQLAEMKALLLPTSVFICFIVSCSNANTNSTDQFPAGTVVANDTCRLIDNYLNQLAIEKSFSGGLLIVKAGKKIFSKGYGWSNREKNIPFTPSTLASMGSITKAFTAAAIMKLTEQGKLSTDDQLEKFFPGIPADKSTITIHQLLTHSSGFHEFIKDDGGDYEKLDTDEFLHRAFTEPLAFHPGEKAEYTNVGMSILGIIIEKVSGTDYENFLKQNLLEPVGIRTIGYHLASQQNDSIAHGYEHGKDWGTIPQRILKAGNQPYWNLKANGGLEASLNDMYLWANAITNHTVLSDTTINKMFTSQVQEEGYGGQSFFGYGCNISRSRRDTKMIDNGGSNGIYYARLVRLPEEGLVLYLVTNENSMNANMVLPNITQLYFRGSIEEDATSRKQRFETQQAEKIYTILLQTKTSDLSAELQKQKVTVDDDMILLEVGQRLIAEKKQDEALSLYQFYTGRFPRIIVAWNDLGDVYLMKGNKEEAKRCYNQALQLKPDNQRAKNSLEKLKQ